MFRMLKLAAYVLFGWFLYEALRGISTPVKPRLASSQAQRNPDDMPEQVVYDPSGARHRQKVGRGVLR